MESVSSLWTTRPAPPRLMDILRKIAGPALLLIVGTALAWGHDQDGLLNLIGCRSAPFRAIAFAFLLSAGIAAANRTNLKLNTINTTRPLGVALSASLGVAVFCGVVDVVFRPVLDPRYVVLLTRTPLIVRDLSFTLQALFESFMYRLALGSVLCWSIGLIWRDPDGAIAPGAYVAGFTLAQIIDAAANLQGLATIHVITLIYYALRFVLPGAAWGWVYKRYGFATQEMAVSTVHLFFQPMATALLISGV